MFKVVPRTRHGPGLETKTCHKLTKISPKQHSPCTIAHTSSHLGWIMALTLTLWTRTHHHDYYRQGQIIIVYNHDISWIKTLRVTLIISIIHNLHYWRIFTTLQAAAAVLVSASPSVEAQLVGDFDTQALKAAVEEQTEEKDSEYYNYYPSTETTMQGDLAQFLHASNKRGKDVSWCRAVHNVLRFRKRHRAGCRGVVQQRGHHPHPHPHHRHLQWHDLPQRSLQELHVHDGVHSTRGRSPVTCHVSRVMTCLTLTMSCRCCDARIWGVAADKCYLKHIFYSFLLLKVLNIY